MKPDTRVICIHPKAMNETGTLFEYVKAGQLWNNYWFPSSEWIVDFDNGKRGHFEPPYLIPIEDPDDQIKTEEQEHNHEYQR